MKTQRGQGSRVCPPPSSGFPGPCADPTRLTASSASFFTHVPEAKKPQPPCPQGAETPTLSPRKRGQPLGLARAGADARHHPSPNSEIKARSRRHSNKRPCNSSRGKDCPPGRSLTCPAAHTPPSGSRPPLARREHQRRQSQEPAGPRPGTPLTGAGSLGAPGLAELQPKDRES